MLNKINHIKNVARFYDVMPSGTSSSDPSFKKFTLIFAENGTGKSTLSSILKSLNLNDPSPILSKTTISGTGASEVSLKLDDTDYVFVNNSWRSTPEKNILIFDEDFVQRNVFTTSGVDANNKRELFNYVILGEENFKKIEEINEIIEELNVLKKEISPLEALLKNASGVSNIEILLNTELIQGNELKDLEKETEELKAQIQNFEKIKSTSNLEKIKNFEWINPIDTLVKDIKIIGDIAEYKAHITQHEEWLEQGRKIQSNSTSCPYCFQDVTNNQAIKAYKEYFSEECQSLLFEIRDLKQKAENNFTEDKIEILIKALNSNNKNCVFWHSLSKEITSKIDFDDNLKEKIKIYSDTLLRLLNKKSEDSLSKIEINQKDLENIEIYKEINKFVTSYNLRVDEENKKIDALKNANGDIDKIKTQFSEKEIIFRCNKTAFYDDKTKDEFEKYKERILERKNKKERLDLLKDETHESSLNVLKKYQKSINDFLQFINVDFRISKVEKKADSTSKETLVYAIKLRGESFDPNGSKAKPYNLSNTLSSGDRSTLAFAFFLAKLEHINLSDTILVFDDPITSLDFFRKQQTSKKILALSKQASQVIVLSHSLEFCKLFGHVPVNSKYFKLNKVKSVNGVLVTPYNKLQELCTVKHKDDHDKITSFLSDPTSVQKVDVMKAVRSYVETLMCVYVPDLTEVHPQTLGHFIKHLRNNGLVSDEYLDQLSFINDSIVEENHGADNPREDSYANLSDDELTALCIASKELNAPPN